MCAVHHALDRDPDDRFRILDEDGAVVEGARVPDLDDETLLTMYEQMRFARRFDERMVSLQRQGRMGTYAPLAGQEGAQIGSTHALHEEDWILYQYREHGAVVVRGMLPDYLEYWMGYEEGNAALADDNIFPLNICIADHLPHATGMAWASNLKDNDEVFVCHFGDGATSEGDFHEAMNYAGVFDVPLVFFCNNNQWAISVPRDQQTASDTIAQKADAYGFDGVQVDGMDPLAVYAVTKEAAAKARTPNGDEPRPTLIEAIQYRYGAHTTADDPTAYRSEEELEEWRRKDPIDRLESYLRRTGRLDDESDDAIGDRIEEELSTLIETAEDRVEPDPLRMFDFVYEEPTPRIAEQREYLEDLIARHGEDALLED